MENLDTKAIFKKYFIFIALPTVILVLLTELAVAPGTWLNIFLRQTVYAGSAELYFLERGG